MPPALLETILSGTAKEQFLILDQSEELNFFLFIKHFFFFTLFRLLPVKLNSYIVLIVIFIFYVC